MIPDSPNPNQYSLFIFHLIPLFSIPYSASSPDSNTYCIQCRQGNQWWIIPPMIVAPYPPVRMLARIAAHFQPSRFVGQWYDVTI